MCCGRWITVYIASCQLGDRPFLMAGMEKLEKMYINQGWYQDGDFGRSLAYRFCGQLRVSAGRAVRLPV